MPLERVLEPEVMDTAEEAVDYNTMDHSGVNTVFVGDLVAFANQHNFRLAEILDLGTGTALIPIELCGVDMHCRVTAIDMAAEMLTVAEQNVAEAGFSDRISLRQVDAKVMPFDDEQFACCMSNSIIHHIPDPSQCIAELVRVTGQGGLIFVRDLLRPDSNEQVEHLVQTYAGNENEHSRQMFDDSLRAALSIDEIRELVGRCGFDNGSVQVTSDRHWTWSAIKS